MTSDKTSPRRPWLLASLVLLPMLGAPLAGDAQTRPPAATAPAARTPAPAATPAPATPAATPDPAPAGPPHGWLFGMWTGGIFPPGDVDSPSCAGSATVIFTRDVVMRSSPLDVAYRQRLIETVSQQQNGLEFRFAPAAPTISAFGAQPPGRDSAFGCANPNALRVERRGEDEIVFPNCSEFPSPLKRCN
ncbi:hypothetical protein ACQW02_10700 [Humitalea sp. 24SJ18S-53]|uniref:hypothetical protein n=1 Tax=Humitalea sp. 24SJ18S-53 TaxID=3422307 RepID=UPI003D673EB8